MALATEPPAADATLEFAALGDGLTFSSQPFDRETEVTGPLAAVSG